MSNPGDAGAEAGALVIEGGQDLGRLYPWLDKAARVLRLPASMLPGMHVALEEAVTNAVLHGFAPAPAGRVAVRLDAAHGVAVLVVEDDGRAVDPTVLPAERPSPQDSAVGGLGLTLMRHFCRDISYARVSDRNRLTLRFPIA